MTYEKAFEINKMSTTYPDKYLIDSDDVGMAEEMIYDLCLKGDKYKWHNLRKDPSDLPTKTRWFLIKVKSSDDYRCVFGYEKLSEIADAWREIEPFSEVE